MMSRDRNASLSSLAGVGFLLVLCVVSSLADPVPANAPVKVEASSVATPLGSSQLVASASDRDEGLSPVGPGVPPTPESDDAGKTAGGAALPPPASEVGDLMKDPYHNVTLSTSDRDEEALINNETVVVHDSHVNPINKTHEEEASASSPETPLGSSTQQPRDEASLQDSSPAPTAESSTSKAEEPERKKIEEHTDKRSEEVVTTEKAAEDEVSLAEVTSLPVLALVSQHDDHDHPAISRTSSLNHTTQAAAILAGVLVLVALMGYLGLLLWRRVLEKRYGHREMLVNEDDDFKHFEL